MMRVELCAFDATKANDLLMRIPHHVQNTAAWFDFVHEFSGEEEVSIGFAIGGEFRGFVRALRFKNLIQSLPYPASYSGPVFDPEVGEGERIACLNLLIEHLATRCDVFSITGSPLMRQDFTGITESVHVLRNRIDVIDLSAPPLAGTTSKFRNNLKRNLRKAEAAGVRGKLQHDTELLGRWYQVYERRMRQLNAPTLPLRYFELMFRHLQPHGQVALLSSLSGKEYFGGTIVVYNRHCADYYLSVYDREYDDLQASTAGLHFLIHWLKSQSVTLFNLQASPSTQGELAHFKQSWGAQSREHVYTSAVLNSATNLLQTMPKEIRQSYPFHFVVPFSALVNCPSAGPVEFATDDSQCGKEVATP